MRILVVDKIAICWSNVTYLKGFGGLLVSGGAWEKLVRAVLQRKVVLAQCPIHDVPK